MSDVQKNDLPGPEALDEPGKKEGQVIMVKAINGTVEAHQVGRYLSILIRANYSWNVSHL